jgi:hypothetical protein
MRKMKVEVDAGELCSLRHDAAIRYNQDSYVERLKSTIRGLEDGLHNMNERRIVWKEACEKVEKNGPSVDAARFKEKLARVCRRHNRMVRGLQGVKSSLSECDHYFVQYGDDGERVR